jgi:hypothetical protein
MKKIQPKKIKKLKVFWLPKVAHTNKKIYFGGITVSLEIGIL